MVGRMVSFWVGIAVGIAVLAVLCWYAAAGFRNGDRATDAKVSAVQQNAGRAKQPARSG